jgi:hypothetical protein
MTNARRVAFPQLRQGEARFIIGTGVDNTPLDAVPPLGFAQKLGAGKPIA